MIYMKLFEAIAVVFALAMAFLASLLVSGNRVLVAEAKVSPSDTYVMAEYGDLGKSSQGDLRLIPVARLAVSSHDNFMSGELADEEAIYRRTDHRDPARSGASRG